MRVVKSLGSAEILEIMGTRVVKNLEMPMQRNHCMHSPKNPATSCGRPHWGNLRAWRQTWLKVKGDRPEEAATQWAERGRRRRMARPD